jgi:phage shock protein PspC (stress-responsive transcriptional regulator)
MTTMSDTGSSPYAGPEGGASAPRTLRRSNNDRIISGVSGGLGQYFGVDPVIFRVLFAVLAFFGGVGLLAYAVAWLLIPEPDVHTSVLDRSLQQLRIRKVPPWLVVLGGAFLLWLGWFSWWAPSTLPAVLLFAVIVLVLMNRLAKRAPAMPNTPPWAGPAATPPWPGRAEGQPWPNPAATQPAATEPARWPNATANPALAPPATAALGAPTGPVSQTRLWPAKDEAVPEDHNLVGESGENIVAEGAVTESTRELPAADEAERLIEPSQAAPPTDGQTTPPADEQTGPLGDFGWQPPAVFGSAPMSADQARLAGQTAPLIPPLSDPRRTMQAWFSEASEAHRKRLQRRRPVKIGVALALLVGWGLVAMLDGFNRVPFPAYLWTGLGILGAGLLISLVTRRLMLSLLIPILFLALVAVGLGGTRASLSDGSGQIGWRPTSASQLTTYRQFAGESTLDLTGLPTLSGPAEVTIDQAAGQVVLRVPNSLNATITADVHLGDIQDGRSNAAGQHQAGVNVHLQLNPASTATGQPLTIHVSLTDGHIQVDRVG